MKIFFSCLLFCQLTYAQDFWEEILLGSPDSEQAMGKFEKCEDPQIYLQCNVWPKKHEDYKGGDHEHCWLLMECQRESGPTTAICRGGANWPFGIGGSHGAPKAPGCWSKYPFNLGYGLSGPLRAGCSFYSEASPDYFRDWQNPESRLYLNELYSGDSKDLAACIAESMDYTDCCVGYDFPDPLGQIGGVTNSNTVISTALARCGLEDVAPPLRHGRTAPGFSKVLDFEGRDKKCKKKWKRKKWRKTFEALTKAPRMPKEEVND